MGSLRPVALYGLSVAPSEDPVPAFEYDQYPATFRLSMAAIDPFAKAEQNETTEDAPNFVGATLRIIRVPNDEDSDDDDEDDLDLDDFDEDDEDDEDDDEDDDDDDEDLAGGPSEPSKSKKAKNEAAVKKALAALKDNMDIDEPSTKASPKTKGKGKAVGGQEETQVNGVQEDEDEDEDNDEEDDEDDDVIELPGPEEFVLCTLDPNKVRTMRHL